MPRYLHTGLARARFLVDGEQRDVEPGETVTTKGLVFHGHMINLDTRAPDPSWDEYVVPECGGVETDEV